VAALAAALSVSTEPLTELAGENEALTPAGNPEAAKLTAPLKPLSGIIVMLSLPLLPCAIDSLALPNASVNPGAASTLKLLDTGAAAAYVALPACEATIVQTPAASSVALVPDTLQMLNVEEL